jgi:hypothetical protein
VITCWIGGGLITLGITAWFGWVAQVTSADPNVTR